jgi:pantothenate kinase type III
VPINDTLRAGVDTPLYVTSKLRNETFNVGGSVMLGIQQWFSELFKTGSAKREDVPRTESNTIIDLTVGSSSGMVCSLHRL